jgi:NADH:ubiquinone oxidoreductase subunit C
MLELFFKKKPDIRNLMLDYPKIEFPMLKEFPVEGHQDIYYNVFEDQVQYIRNEYVEI